MSFLSKATQIMTVGAVVAGLSGCVPGKQKLTEINTHMDAGSYEQAAQDAIANGKIQEDGKTSDLLWSLQAGSLLTLTGDFNRSNLIFDQAELLMKDEDTENIGKRSLENATEILFNNSLNGYEPTVYDSVMVNTYKGLNYVLMQDWQNARIEFNRASDRQRRAEEHFKKKIAEEQKKIDEEKDKLAKEGKTSEKGSSQDEARSKINEEFAEMDQWKVYGDYINPYSDYLHGLFFMLAGSGDADYERAVFSLNRVAGMHGRNSVIKKDLLMAKNLKSGAWKRDKVRPQVWVIFENGAAPRTEETLIPIPLFLITDEIAYSQIALPKLVEQPIAYPSLEVSVNNKKIGNTVQISSMDRVVQSEFKKEFPMRVTKGILSTITKGVATHVAQEKLGLFGNIAGSLYQAGTTRVDTRSWTTLPKEVQALRIRRPENNTITLNAPGIPQPLTVNLPDSRYTLVYVKAVGSNTEPALQVVGFNS